MSTFDGLIREFPTIVIDNFKLRPSINVYMLSHVHSDHLAGLATLAWDSPIYCSPITATWLPMLSSKAQQVAYENGKTRTLQRKYAHLAPYLRPLATNVPHYIELGNGRQVRCSLLPAHHCPGAVMFLLQDDRSCILYTGDARNEAMDLQTLRAMPPFLPSSPPIDRLYVDTTCCHPAFYEFPTRATAVADLVHFITHRPRLAHYYIDVWTFGYEEIWIALSTTFRSKIHVSPYLYQLYEAIDHLIEPKILPHLTLDGTSARFHSCRLGSTCGYGGAGGPGAEHASARELIWIQPNVSWFSEMLQKERQERTGLGQRSVELVQTGQVVGRRKHFHIREKIPPCISKRDNLFYYLNFACHASLSELEQLVQVVAPKALFPCVLHRDSSRPAAYSESNRTITGLLSRFMPVQAQGDPLAEDEDYGDIEGKRAPRDPCVRDGVTTDFQDYQLEKPDAFNRLDMDDHLLNGGQGNGASNRNVVIIESTPPPRAPASMPCAGYIKIPSPLLSPRARHLRNKMKRLERQLRSTASLEEEGYKGGNAAGGERFEEGSSTTSEGPLSLDLEGIERRRQWWVASADRGKSTTFEEEDDDDEQEQESRVVENEAHILLQTMGKFGTKLVEGEATEDRQLYDQRSLELEVETELENAVQGAEEEGDSCIFVSRRDVTSASSSPCSVPMTVGRRSSYPAPSDCVAVGTQEPRAAMAFRPIYLSSDLSSVEAQPFPSIPPSASFDVLASLAPGTDQSRTPPPRKCTQNDVNSQNKITLSLGKSPTSTRHYQLAPLELEAFKKPMSGNNIYTQLAWSPPLRPLSVNSRLDPPSSKAQRRQGQRSHRFKLCRAQTGPHPHGQARPLLGTVLPKRARTTMVDSGQEVILIESSEDDGDDPGDGRGDGGWNKSMAPRGRKKSRVENLMFDTRSTLSCPGRPLSRTVDGGALMGCSMSTLSLEAILDVPAAARLEEEDRQGQLMMSMALKSSQDVHWLEYATLEGST